MITQKEFETLRVGDKIMFTTNLSIASNTTGWINSMQKMLGKVGTVTALCTADGIPYGFHIEEDGCWYHRDTIDCIVSTTKKPSKIKISTKSLF